MSKKRKPTARDRDTAMLLLDLPVGKHLVDVREDNGGAILKPEGGTIIRHHGNIITIVPRGQEGFRKVTLT